MPGSLTLSPQAPLPLETLGSLGGLDGRDGTNRARSGVRQLAATNDLEAIRAWLTEYEASPHTWRAYRREAERLLSWTLIERGLAVSSLAREDLQAYGAFLTDPTPRARWCGPRRSRSHAAWRPFQGPLDRTSRDQALTIVRGLFSYLVRAGYLATNPMGLEPRVRRRATRLEPIERALDGPTWAYLWQHLADLPATTPRGRRERARLRFVFGAGYLLAPRVEELAHHTMGSFKRLRGRWWWAVRGKGEKDARMPVPAALLTLLGEYRMAYGLAELPEAGEGTPLVLNLSGTRGVTANMIYRLVTATCQAAAAALEASDAERAAILRRASPHWLRHTSLSHQADAGIDLRYLNLNARHAKFETTRRYVHANDAAWHAAMDAFATGGVASRASNSRN